MFSIKAAIIAVIAIVLSLGFLVFITQYYNPDNPDWLALWVFVGVMIAVFGGWILLVGRSGLRGDPLKTMDFAMIALFAALFMVVDAGSMFTPGLVGLWYILPQFAGGILAYFPMAILLTATLKLSPKPGTAFTLLIVYGIIATLILFFNPVWFFRIIVLALGVEAYHITSERGKTSSLMLGGLMFGIMISSSAAIFQIYSWAYWQPLFMTLPAAIFAGIMATIGAFLGSALGERAKTVVY